MKMGDSDFTMHVYARQTAIRFNILLLGLYQLWNLSITISWKPERKHLWAERSWGTLLQNAPVSGLTNTRDVTSQSELSFCVTKAPRLAAMPNDSCSFGTFALWSYVSTARYRFYIDCVDTRVDTINWHRATGVHCYRIAGSVSVKFSHCSTLSVDKIWRSWLLLTNCRLLFCKRINYYS